MDRADTSVSFEMLSCYRPDDLRRPVYRRSYFGPRRMSYPPEGGCCSRMISRHHRVMLAVGCVALGVILLSKTKWQTKAHFLKVAHKCRFPITPTSTPVFS